MKSKVLKWLAVLAACTLLCGALTSCDFSEKSISDWFNEAIGVESDTKDPDKEENEGGTKDPSSSENQGGNSGNTNTGNGENQGNNNNQGGNQGNGGNQGTTTVTEPFAPSVGQNGNWWIGNVDLGIHAQASQGIAIKDIRLSSDGTELAITYTDETILLVSLPEEVKEPCFFCVNVTVYALKCYPHTATFDEATNAWILTKGRGLQFCNGCGNLTLVNTLKHVYGEAEVIAPTCEENGYTKKPCTECDFYEVVAGSQTDKKGHTYVPVPGATIPSDGCTNGYRLLCACTTDGCDSTDYVYFEPAGHSVTEWRADVAPTLTAEGSLIGTCEKCNDSVVRLKLPALNETDYTCVSEEVTCLKGGKATYTYTVTQTNQTFVYYADIPPASHVVRGVPVTDLKRVDDALVYGQAGVEIFSSVVPKCGEVVSGFYTCDICHVNFSTKVAGAHTWGTPTYEAATCQKPGVTVRYCTAAGCDGRSEEITAEALPHTMTYALTYDAEAKIFHFEKSCATCSTQTTSTVVTPERDVEGSQPPMCNQAGYNVYVYTFVENGTEKSVSCRVESGTPSGEHQFIVDGMIILPDEIAPGVLAYSSEWIGKGLYVLTNMGEVEPDRETCGNVYDGYFQCACGASYKTVKIYNAHALVPDPTHADNKAPTETENGIAVYVCSKANCNHVEKIEIER